MNGPSHVPPIWPQRLSNTNEWTSLYVWLSWAYEQCERFVNKADEFDMVELKVKFIAKSYLR